MQKRIAIVTGATGGVGTKFIEGLCKEELDEIWAVARNEQKLTNLSEMDTRIVTITTDLSKCEGWKLLDSLLKRDNPVVCFLVNNAGLARMAQCTDFSVEEIESTIDLNCKAPVILSNICIPYMERGSHILNISSASAFQPNPYINLYASTKVFERHYSRALNVELKKNGITVTAVCPGWIDTEMLEREINGKTVKFPGIVTAERVVKKAIKDAKRGKDMSICSLYVKCQHFNVKLMPQRLVMKMWMKGIKDYI